MRDNNIRDFNGLKVFLKEILGKNMNNKKKSDKLKKLIMAEPGSKCSSDIN
jgi:hypothetical protein